MLESEEEFNDPKAVAKFRNRENDAANSYYFSLWKYIKEKYDNDLKSMKKGGAVAGKDEVTEKKYVFIIDEINRGEISKIFGELFFSIDPGYSGKLGAVTTQYDNMHDEDDDEKFYIPENVYIIGTMNDIDRSVDTFDFAMRRRFRFIEIKPDDTADDIFEGFNDGIDKSAVKVRMNRLNDKISNTPGLNRNYQIGAAYFKRLNDIDGSEDQKYDALWSDYLEPLLRDYVQGMNDEENIIKSFKEAYDIRENDSDETSDIEG